MLELSQYEALRQRPDEVPVMLQSWRDLLFLHYPCDPALIQATLPEGLTVDTYPDAQGDEQAWIGLVPFRMEGVRPRRLPAVPGLSDFPETNVRTYVHRDGQAPGVWFYSLEAANALACRIARHQFSLPYHFAEMSVSQSDTRFTYASRRMTDGALSSVAAELKLAAEVVSATPGTLEFFLAERYVLYALHRGRLMTGRVHHTPYPLVPVTSFDVQETLTRAAQLPPGQFSHALCSPGVNVEVFGLRP